MAALPLRPRSVGELVDAGFQLLRQNFVQFVVLMALIQVPWLVLTLVAQRLLGVDLARRDLASIPAGYWAFSGVASILFLCILEGVLTVATADAYMKGQVDVGATFARTFARLGSLIVAGVVRSAAIVVGFVLLVAPGLYLLARYFAAAPAMLVEGRGPMASLGRSGQLSRGEKWRIVGTLVLMWFMYFLLSTAVSLFVGFLLAMLGLQSAATLTSTTLTQLLGVLLSIVAFPTLIIVQTLLYYDLRIRREGYDIEMMASHGAGDARAEQPAY